MPVHGAWQVAVIALQTTSLFAVRLYGESSIDILMIFHVGNSAFVIRIIGD